MYQIILKLSTYKFRVILKIGSYKQNVNSELKIVCDGTTRNSKFSNSSIIHHTIFLKQYKGGSRFKN